MRAERRQKMETVLSRRQSDLVIILENIGDPHNIGAIMRSADSVGVQEIFVINSVISEDEYKTKRSSGSAEKWLSLHHFETVIDCVTELKKRNLTILGTHLGVQSQSLYEIDFCQPIALAFGTERTGLSAELLQYCDGNFVIPQIGMIQSLNVSVACAVSLYEAFRQRIKNNHPVGLGSVQHENLYYEWMKPYQEK